MRVKFIRRVVDMRGYEGSLLEHVSGCGLVHVWHVGVEAVTSEEVVGDGGHGGVNSELVEGV